MTDRFKEALERLFQNSQYFGEDGINWSAEGDKETIEIIHNGAKALLKANADTIEQLRKENDELKVKLENTVYELASCKGHNEELKAKLEKAKWQPIQRHHIGEWLLVSIDQQDNEGQYTGRKIVCRGFIDRIDLDGVVYCLSDVGECNPTMCYPLPDAPEQL